jgi:hypothetical protein
MCFCAAAFLIGVGLGLAWLNFGEARVSPAQPAQTQPSHAPMHVLRGPVPV